MLQVDASGTLPPPARVGRSDVASLAVASCDSSIVPSKDSYALAVRWVGANDVTPKAQETTQDECDSAEACLHGIVQESSSSKAVQFKEPNGIKPYGVAVGTFFYAFAAAASLKIVPCCSVQQCESFEEYNTPS